jgi:hypothetical protein
MPSFPTKGLPPSRRNDPHELLVILALAAEGVAVTSGSPATVLATGLLAWVLRCLIDLGSTR